jgi:hypothetical protein
MLGIVMEIGMGSTVPIGAVLLLAARLQLPVCALMSV